MSEWRCDSRVVRCRDHEKLVNSGAGGGGLFDVLSGRAC